MIEGSKKLEPEEPEIDELLDSPNVALLRRYRNGTFQFHRQWLDPKLTDFCGARESVACVEP